MRRALQLGITDTDSKDVLGGENFHVVSTVASRLLSKSKKRTSKNISERVCEEHKGLICID